MNTFFEPPIQQSPDSILCYYYNGTNKIQLATSSNLPNWSFEQVIFPGQRLLFEAPGDAIIELHIVREGRMTLIERIKCDRLRIHGSRSASFTRRTTEAVKHLPA